MVKKYCTRCLYSSDHPLGLTFNDDGVCSGCIIHEEKDKLDWESRWSDLEKLVKPYRSTSASYDCIVPISGANDSFFILDIVVNRLKLKPLVVCYNKLFNTKVGIENLARLRIQFNVDFQQKVVDPRTVKKITRASIYKSGNPYWHCLAGKTVYPVQTSVMMRIPLIIWGAHQGLEQVGMFSHLHNVEMTRRYRKDHDLFGLEPENLLDTSDDLNDEDLVHYRYPAFSDLNAIGVRGIYLGNYVRWDPYAQHIAMVKEHGYKGLEQSRTFDKYDHADCYVYSNIHDVFKYLKHGYSKVTDQACREIRFGRLTRQQAKVLVAHYEGQTPDHMEKFCDWLDVNPTGLKLAIERHRNKALWGKNEQDVWQRLDSMVVEDAPSPKQTDLSYPHSEELTYEDSESKYITIGKGVDWPNPRKKNRSFSWID